MFQQNKTGTKTDYRRDGITSNFLKAINVFASRIPTVAAPTVYTVRQKHLFPDQ